MPSSSSYNLLRYYSIPLHSLAAMRQRRPNPLLLYYIQILYTLTYYSFFFIFIFVHSLSPAGVIPVAVISICTYKLCMRPYAQWVPYSDIVDISNTHI